MDTMVYTRELEKWSTFWKRSRVSTTVKMLRGDDFSRAVSPDLCPVG